jgi:hypothetical protein
VKGFIRYWLALWPEANYILSVLLTRAWGSHSTKLCLVGLDQVGQVQPLPSHTSMRRYQAGWAPDIIPWPDVGLLTTKRHCLPPQAHAHR